MAGEHSGKEGNLQIRGKYHRVLGDQERVRAGRANARACRYHKGVHNMSRK